MEKRTMMFSLAMLLFLFSVGAADRLTSKVDNKLKLLNMPSVKSIKSEDGDIVDCVDIYKQPAFDHPALRNHKIQMKPSFELLSEAPSPSSHVQNDLNASQLAFTQTWQKSGSCPEGTIPIRRIQRQDLLRARSLEHFGKKPSLHSYSRNGGIVLMNGTRVDLDPAVNRSAAIIITQGQNYIGAEGIINLWNPRVEGPDEFTSAQIWMKNGPGDAFESVESGWMVNPQLYGDRASRLFVYWTSDAYKSKGCFDLTCPGFVQTNKNIALGMALKPISSAMGPQYEGIYSILQDTYTGNWWLSLGADIRVGYWPGELFHYLTYSAATLVEWGGEVYSYKVKQVHPHTATDMGSGAYAEGKFRNACYIRQIRIVNYSKRYPIWVIPFTDEKSCYTALNDPESPAQDPVFYFGGPGQNPPNCL